MRRQCQMYAEVNGEPSKLYIDLLKKTNNRPLTNLIYATYLQPGVAAQITSQGYGLNKQGQHSADALIQIFNVNKLKLDIGRAGEVSQRIGAKEANGDLHDYASAEEAYRVAQQANSQYEATVSYVTQSGDKFNVITVGKDSRTQYRAYEVERNLAMWESLKQSFSTIGVDISQIDFKTLVNPSRTKQFIYWLRQMGNTRNSLLSKNEIQTLLSLDENSSQVQRLKQMFGSIDNAATKIYEAFRSRGQTVTQGQMTLINSALDICKRVQGLDLSAVEAQLNQIETGIQTSSKEYNVQNTLNELNRDYGINYEEIHRISRHINTLSEAASDAAFTLQRQLKKLKSEQGITQEVRNLETSINRLTREISAKRYYAGVLGFLSDAAKQVQEMENIFQQANQVSGTVMERSVTRSKALMEIKRIRKGYKHIVDALSDIDNIIIDEDVSSVDKQIIQSQARAIKEIFDKYESRVDALEESTMLDIASEFLGTTVVGTSVADIVTMAKSDSSIYDYMYSIGRVSNPLIATMGSIIRDAQEERTQKLVAISNRIKRANHKLRKSGSNSAFMYETDSNYIISDIDWITYNKERREAVKRYIAQGKTGLELEVEMENWDESHTEERIVDYYSGRAERVPNSNYRKAFPNLTSAQMEYYNEMMQIKGEIGTLLPKYAQKQYLPPQKRRSFFDALAASKGNPIKVARAILKRMKDLVAIREDDILDAQNGVLLDGEEYSVTRGMLDNIPYKQIPIFFINRLRDQDELLKDFSGALQALASTAINYNCMEQIRDTVEFMGDFIKKQEIVARNRKGEPQAEALIAKGIRVFKDLVRVSNSSITSGLVDGFLDQHLYGVKLKKIGRWTKLATSLLHYNSIRSLTVNVKGMISNFLVGELQMLIESGAMEFYNPVDYIWAHAKVFGDNTINAPGRIMDWLSNNVNSKSVLLAQRFDPLNEQFDELSYERYHNSPLRKLLGKDFTFIGYGAGEHLIHFVNMYAVLHNIKVKIDGKNDTLYNAFTKSDKEDGSSELVLKNNVTYKDSEGRWVPVDDAYLDSVRGKIRYCNQTTHGSMNEADKGLVHQYMLGRFVANLRQWMVEHYSRRFRRRYWDASLKQEREGYYTTVGKFMRSWAADLFHFESQIALHWKDMDKGQKANCRRALSEQFVLASLLGLSFVLGEPEDHKKEFWMRMWIYQTKRAIMDTRGSSPYGVPMELDKLINSPIAATNTVNALMYLFVGLGDLDDTIKSGRYKGWNKYGRNMLKYWLPFYDQIDQLNHMDEDEAVFAVFNDRSMK